MNMIRPVSDLRNNFADISKTVHETAQPVFLTKNGYGDMVVLSMEAPRLRGGNGTEVFSIISQNKGGKREIKDCR